MLESRALGFSINSNWLVRDIQIRAEARQVWALVGPNGAGKTTLLRMLSGELRPSVGEVRYLGRPLHHYSPKELAVQRGCLRQHRARSFPFTCQEVVMMGRLPHTRGFRETDHDRAVAHEAMARTGVAEFAQRLYATLSGGEAARTDIARILAQEPALFLLDEPTNHLDLRRQFEILRVCRDMAGAGCSVVAVLHDLNLASLFSDYLLLMHNGRCVCQGTPDEVLTRDALRQVYDIECELWRHPSGCPWVVPCSEETQTSLFATEPVVRSAVMPVAVGAKNS